MNINKSKLLAIITGFISIFICILYLLLITIFDFRNLLNDHLSSLPESMAAILLEMDFLPLSLFF